MRSRPYALCPHPNQVQPKIVLLIFVSGKAHGRSEQGPARLGPPAAGPAWARLLLGPPGPAWARLGPPGPACWARRSGQPGA